MVARYKECKGSGGFLLGFFLAHMYNSNHIVLFFLLPFFFSAEKKGIKGGSNQEKPGENNAVFLLNFIMLLLDIRPPCWINHSREKERGKKDTNV